MSSSRGLHILGLMRALVSPSVSIVVSLPLCLKLKNFIIYVSLCNSKIHIITMYSGHVCIMRQCFSVGTSYGSWLELTIRA
jgi:hypothetical protein